MYVSCLLKLYWGHSVGVAGGERVADMRHLDLGKMQILLHVRNIRHPSLRVWEARFALKSSLP